MSDFLSNISRRMLGREHVLRPQTPLFAEQAVSRLEGMGAAGDPAETDLPEIDASFENPRGAGERPDSYESSPGMRLVPDGGAHDTGPAEKMNDYPLSENRTDELSEEASENRRGSDGEVVRGTSSPINRVPPERLQDRTPNAPNASPPSERSEERLNVSGPGRSFSDPISRTAKKEADWDMDGDRKSPDAGRRRSLPESAGTESGRPRIPGFDDRLIPTGEPGSDSPTSHLNAAPTIARSRGESTGSQNRQGETEGFQKPPLRGDAEWSAPDRRVHEEADRTSGNGEPDRVPTVERQRRLVPQGAVPHEDRHDRYARVEAHEIRPAGVDRSEGVRRRGERPTINVTIGRIEVRSVRPEPTVRTTPKPESNRRTMPTPPMSLEEYLKHYNGRKR